MRLIIEALFNKSRTILLVICLVLQKEYQKLGSKKYYEWLGDEEEKVKKSNDKVENIDRINPGDWVTIVRRYAKEHGQDNLNNKFRIISKKVKAKDVYTDGNSLAEWGYSP